MDIAYDHLPTGPCPLCSHSSYDKVTTRFDGGPVVRCASCEHVYLNPPLSDEMLDEIYSSYHQNESDEALLAQLDEWCKEEGSPYQKALSVIKEKGGFEGKKILGIGCGPAVFLNECKKLGAEVKGIDPSPHSVKLAKQYFQIEVEKAYVEDAINHASDYEAYDYVCAFEIIEHVRYPEKLVTSISNFVRPYGRMFVSTPNFGLYEKMGEAAPVVNNWQEHLHFFEKDVLKKLVESLNFRVETLCTLSEISEVEQKKQALVRNKRTKQAWDLIKTFPGVQKTKQSFFKMLENQARAQSKQEDQGNGLHLFCCAQKQPVSANVPGKLPV